MISELVPLVGRGAELGTLTLALDSAADGVAGVVALKGDAGVGKLGWPRSSPRLLGPEGL